MAVTLVERVSVEGTSKSSLGAADGLTIAATPQEGDVLVLAVTPYENGLGSDIVSVVGLGATWEESRGGYNAFWAGFDATSAGDVTITFAPVATTVRATLYLVRGLTSHDMESAVTAGFYSPGVATGPSIVAGAGQFVVSTLRSAAPVARTFPRLPVPATGWVTPETATAQHGDIYRIPTVFGTEHRADTQLNSQSASSMGIFAIGTTELGAELTASASLTADVQFDGITPGSWAAGVLEDLPYFYHRMSDDPASGVMTDISGNNRHGVILAEHPIYEGVALEYGLTTGVSTPDPDKALVFGPSRTGSYPTNIQDILGYDSTFQWNEGGSGQTNTVPFALESFTIEVLAGMDKTSRLGVLNGNDEYHSFGSLRITKGEYFELLIGRDSFNLSLYEYSPTALPYRRVGFIGSYKAFNEFEVWPDLKHIFIAFELTSPTTCSLRVVIDGVAMATENRTASGNKPWDMSLNKSEPFVVTGNKAVLDEFAVYPTALPNTRATAKYPSRLARVLVAEDFRTGRGITIRRATATGTSLQMLAEIKPKDTNPTPHIEVQQVGVAYTLLYTPAQIVTPTPSPVQVVTAVGEMSFSEPPGELRQVIPAFTRVITNYETAVDLGVDPIIEDIAVAPFAFGTQKTFPLHVMAVRIGLNIRCRLVNSSSPFVGSSDRDTKAVYRLLVVNQAGVPQTELTDVALNPIPWGVTGTLTYAFDIAADSPGAEWCQEMRSEIQVWRNDRLCFWGVMVRVSNNGKIINVQSADLGHYFNRRVIGRVPKKNLLQSRAPGEPASIEGWATKSLPRSGDGGGPAKSTTTEDSYNDQAALRLSSSSGRESKTYANDNWYSDGDRLTVAAKKSLRTLMEPLAEFTTNRPTLMVAVYDDSVGSRDASDNLARDRAEAVADFVLDEYPRAKVVITAPAYRKPLNNNGTADKKAANRRTVVTYKSVDGSKGHKQHATQSVILRNPGPKERKQVVTFSTYVNVENAVGWAAEMKGVELIRSDPKKKHPDKKWKDRGYLKPIQTSVVPFGDGVQPEVWFRVETSVILPNDGKRSHIEVRLFPPNGDALFSEMWLTQEEALTFRHKEQADIIKTLVEHAQDEKMGKSDLNIKTNTPKTGVKRSRDYPFSERATIMSLLEEFPKLGDGVEWQIIASGSERVFTTYYPRMGKDTTVVLSAGSNVVSYGVGSDGTLLATTVVIQAPTGEGHSREERTVSDPTLMDGLVLETVYTGTPNSPASSWRRQAERGLARYRRPVVIPDVTLDPASTDELLDTVSIGDRVTTDISNVIENIDVFQKARITDITLDPKTDSLKYSLTPEDLNILTLSQFGAQVKYLSQAQNPIVGASGKNPVESNPEYATRAYNDAGWATGAAGVGWVQEATGNLIRNPQHTPVTTVPDNHEVWVRKWVKCTGDMVLTVRLADWGYVYVNGHKVGRGHFDGYNVLARVAYVNLRIPSSWMDSSGDQLVALHAQFDPARRSGPDMDSLYADVAVRGTFDAAEIA